VEAKTPQMGISVEGHDERMGERYIGGMILNGLFY